MKRWFKKIATWLLNKLTTRPAKHLDYDTTTTEKGLLSDDAEKQRRRNLREDLREGDSYRLGPNARVHVGPPGRAGKAWVTARVKASEAAREKKYREWWEKKRARCVEIMMMSEEELKSSGIYAEVQEFVKENAAALKWAASNGLLKGRMPEAAATEKAAPSGHRRDRVAQILEDSGLMKDGKLTGPNPEAYDAMKASPDYDALDLIAVGKSDKK